MKEHSRARRFARFLRQVLLAALSGERGAADAARPPDMDRVQHSMGVNWTR